MGQVKEALALVPVGKRFCSGPSWRMALTRVPVGLCIPLLVPDGSLSPPAGWAAGRAPRVSGYVRRWQEHSRIGRAILVTHFPQKYLRVPTVHCPTADGPPWVFD